MTANRTALDVSWRPLHAHLMERGVRDIDAARIAAAFVDAHRENAQRALDTFLEAGWRGNDILHLITFDDASWRRNPAVLLEAQRVLIEYGVDESQTRMILITKGGFYTGSVATLRENLAFLIREGLAARDITVVAAKFPQSLYFSKTTLENMRDAAALNASPEEKLDRLLGYLLHMRKWQSRPAPRKKTERKIAMESGEHPTAVEQAVPEPAPKSDPIPASAPMPNPPPSQPRRKVAPVAPRPKPAAPKEEPPPAVDIWINGDALKKRLRTIYRYVPDQKETSRLQALMDHFQKKKDPERKWCGIPWESFLSKYAWIDDNGQCIEKNIDLLDAWLGNDFAFLIHVILHVPLLHPVLQYEASVLTTRLHVIRRWLGANIVQRPTLLLKPFEGIRDSEQPHMPGATVIRLRVNEITRRKRNPSHPTYLTLLFAKSGTEFSTGLQAALSQDTW